MTLRRTIAAALRTSAHNVRVVALREVTCAAVCITLGDSAVADRFLGSAERLSWFADRVSDAARWLDPQPQPAAAGVERDGERVEPAPPAARGGVGGEQATRSAAAGAQGGHGGEGTMHIAPGGYITKGGRA